MHRLRQSNIRNGTSSEIIYLSDEGLDMRYSRPGYYGNGIYFADNSVYSH
jgi:hypothetical protein